MSLLRPFDVRFVLPDLPARVEVEGVPGWPDGTAVAGPRRGSTLLVIPATAAAPALPATSAVLAVGGSARRRRPPVGGLRRLHLLALPDLRQPRLVVCLEHPVAASYALRVWPAAERPAQRVRNLVAGSAARVPALLRPLSSGTLDAAPGPPAFVTAAANASGEVVDRRSGWFLTVPGGDDLTRPVLHLVPPGEYVPSHVVKLSRVPGHRHPFEQDERAAALLRRAGPAVASRAPAVVARFELHGHSASVEQAALGVPLDRVLRRHGTGALPTVEAICAWILDLGAATARPRALGPELGRLGDVLASRSLPSDLLAPLAGLPGVLQHNDLGSWNIHVDGGSFAVLDWESARDDGLPLWDLAYFLGDALPLVAGARSFEERAEAAADIFAGRHALSGVLFEWIERAARLMSMPDDAIGPAVLTGWLHHATSHVARQAALFEAGAPAGPVPAAERLADRWLTDTLLGTGWRAWADRRNR